MLYIHPGRMRGTAWCLRTRRARSRRSSSRGRPPEDELPGSHLDDNAAFFTETSAEADDVAAELPGEAAKSVLRVADNAWPVAAGSGDGFDEH